MNHPPYWGENAHFNPSFESKTEHHVPIWKFQAINRVKAFLRCIISLRKTFLLLQFRKRSVFDV